MIDRFKKLAQPAPIPEAPAPAAAMDEHAADRSSTPTVHSTVMLDRTKIRKNRWNPNVEADETFNQLVENIKQVGFTVPVQVRRLKDDDLTEQEKADGIEFEVVGGEHRFRAAEVLEMPEIPGTVMDWDEDLAKAQTVALNIISGKMDPKKFTVLYNSLSTKGYQKDVIAQMMRFNDSRQMEKFIQAAKVSLPPDLQKQLEKSKKDIKNVDDLSNVLNEMFRSYGSTLDYSYMVFTFAGKTHLWLKMNSEMRTIVENLKETCKTQERDINDVVTEMLVAGADAAKVTVNKDKRKAKVGGKHANAEDSTESPSEVEAPVHPA